MAIAGKRARSKARQHTGCRSGLLWPGRGAGLLAGIGCIRMPRLPPAWPVLAGLDHRQAVPGRRRDSTPTADRGCCGVVRISGGAQSPTNWRCCGHGVQLVGQFGRVFVLSIGEAGHEATTAPVSSGAWWRSPASGPGRRRGSTPAADRGCCGLVKVPGCWQASVAGVARVVAVLNHRQTGVAVVRACSSSGSSAGSSYSRSVKPATRRQRRQCRAVPGSDRRQVVSLPRQAGGAVPLVMDFGYRDLVGLSRGRPPLLANPISFATSLARPSIQSSLLLGIPFFSSPYRKGFNSR